jgi:uncharacterized protein YbjQ (UPF0145 family)
MTGIGGNEAIYRGDRRELIVIDNEQRSYMVMDEATIKRLMAQVSQVMGQMQDMLKNMPESQRAAMEEMMRGRGMAMGADRPTIEIRATGQTGTRGKYAVRQFEVLTDGRKTQELWATNWSNIDGYQEARPVMEDMANYFKALTEGMPSASQDASQELMSYMSEIDGFPVATTMFDASGSPTGGSELKGTRRETLSASEFEPPAGYRQQALPGMQ